MKIYSGRTDDRRPGLVSGGNAGAAPEQRLEAALDRILWSGSKDVDRAVRRVGPDVPAARARLQSEIERAVQDAYGTRTAEPHHLEVARAYLQARAAHYHGEAEKNSGLVRKTNVNLAQETFLLGIQLPQLVTTVADASGSARVVNAAAAALRRHSGYVQTLADKIAEHVSGLVEPPGSGSPGIQLQAMQSLHNMVAQKIPELERTLAERSQEYRRAEIGLFMSVAVLLSFLGVFAYRVLQNGRYRNRALTHGENALRYHALAALPAMSQPHQLETDGLVFRDLPGHHPPVVTGSHVYTLLH